MKRIQKTPGEHGENQADTSNFTFTLELIKVLLIRRTREPGQNPKDTWRELSRHRENMKRTKQTQGEPGQNPTDTWGSRQMEIMQKAPGWESNSQPSCCAGNLRT